MFTIIEAKPSDFIVIQEIAFATWPATYGDILSSAQLKYMLDKFYNIDSLRQVSKKNHDFYLLALDGIFVGFIDIEHDFNGLKVTKIHKLYILPHVQGKNAGRFLINFAEEKAIQNHSTILTLNVNKFNKAVAFYQKMAFEIVADEIIELDFGYVMDDFRMERKIGKIKD